MQDVLMTMELALHRLRGKDVATVWVAAPCLGSDRMSSRPVRSSNDAEAPRKLYFHRIPQREAGHGGPSVGGQDVFQALGKLFARMQVSMEALRMLKGDKFTAAEVVFTSQAGVKCTGEHRGPRPKRLKAPSKQRNAETE